MCNAESVDTFLCGNVEGIILAELAMDSEAFINSVESTKGIAILNVILLIQ